MSSIKYLLVMLFSIAVVACGGGGSSAPATYAISGTITGASGVVAVGLSGTSTATTSTASNGTYSFTGLANGSYTVIPTLAGYAFTPTSTAVTVSGANVTGKNFTATAAATTYTISGSAGIAGATITLSGANSGTLTAGTGGAYTFSGLVNGSYTVTPSLTGYTFAPTSASVTISSANATATTFVPTAIPVAHTLSGNVSPSLSGVTITVTGGTTNPPPATTDASGNYSFTGTTGLYDGTYTVTPTKTGYTFTPNSTSVTMAGANVTGKNFAGTANSAVTATANGTVTGDWIQGVTITLSGGGQSGTTTTNASGNYSFGNLPSGQTYTFTPTLAGYTFGTAPTATVPGGSSTAVTVPAITATSAIASTSISGTVSYPVGTNTGGIRIQAYYPGCTSGCSAAGGTVIPATGAYTIRGLQPGTYNVIAEMDAQHTGQDNANNPISPAVAADTTAGNATGINPVLADPATPTALAPTGLSVSPGSGGALVQYTAPTNTNGQEIATSYQLTWGTTNTGTGTGSANFAAQGTNQTVYMQNLASGTYYYKLTACVGGTVACVGGTSSAASTVSTAITIGAIAGGNTISGTVTFTGTAAGPMYVAIHNNAGAYVQRVAGPITSGVTSYSITGVPPGSYNVAVIIDNNNDGLINLGDFTNANNNGGPAINVTGSATANITLPSANATSLVGTDNFQNTTYTVNSSVTDGTKRVASATLFSGPNIAVPVDMSYGNGYGNLNSYSGLGATVPVVGDTYKFKVTYSDGTSETISSSVTAVLNSFAGLSPVTNPTSATPSFSWTAPASPPASYVYTLSVSDTAGNQFWYYPSNSNGMPSTQLSVGYDADGFAAPLGTAGTVYNWQVQVRDANNNSATQQATFTH